jgi:hypothetical protein
MPDFIGQITYVLKSTCSCRAIVANSYGFSPAEYTVHKELCQELTKARALEKEDAARRAA